MCRRHHYIIIISISLVIAIIFISLCSLLTWYFISTAEHGKCTENRIPVSSSYKLHKVLERSAECDVIELLDEEYDIDFSILIKSRISLEGRGSNRTLLRVRHNRENATIAALNINGFNSSITGIKIVLFDNVDWASGINIRGGGNTLRDIQLSGMDPQNNSKTITPTATEGSLFCIKLNGNENQVESITCSHVPNGILVNGNMNKLKKLNYHKKFGCQESVAVQISEGSENEVDDLKCEGLDRNDWGVLLQSGTKKAKILNAQCGPVWVNGEETILSNVDAKEYLKIEGNGHKLDNVEAEIIMNEASLVESTNTSFNYTTRRIKVNNSEQFYQALIEAKERDIIELVAGDYDTDRPIKVPPGVLVLGAGSNRTTFRSNIFEDNKEWILDIQTNSEVSGLTIIGFGNNGYVDILVRGSSNILKDIVVGSTKIHFSIKMGANLNRVSDLSTWSINPTRIYIGGDDNRLKHLTVGVGGPINTWIFVRGSRNIISNVHYAGNSFELSGGSDNVLDEIRCTGDENDDNIRLYWDTRRVTISNSNCGPVIVHGEDHHLVNVDAGKKLRISGHGHRVDNCSAKKWVITGEHLINSILPANNSQIEECTQNPTVVKESAHLSYLLRNMAECDILNVYPGKYDIYSPIFISSPRVQIHGVGPDTFLRVRVQKQKTQDVVLAINANNCSLSRMTILISDGSGQALHGTHVRGRHNFIRHVTFVHSSSGRIGNYDGGRSETRDFNCIQLDGDWNGLERVSCSNFSQGVLVAGNMNTFKFLKTPTKYETVAIHLLEGSANVVEGLSCEGLTYNSGDWGLILNPETKEGMMSNSVCGPVRVQGSNTMLLNWDAQDYLIVAGKGHKIENVGAKNFMNNGRSIVLTNSTFGFTIKGNSGPELNISLDNRNITRVTTTEELHNALRDSGKGSEIHLRRGIYIGQFQLRQDEVFLKGLGDHTIFQFDTSDKSRIAVALNISGNNCKVQNITIISETVKDAIGIEIGGSGNTITAVQLQGFGTAISTLNENNNGSNLLIKNGDFGCVVHTNRNTFRNITFQNIAKVAIRFLGNNNSIYDLRCDRCDSGISVEGNHNDMEKVDMRNSLISIGSGWKYGLWIVGGSGNVVDSFHIPDSLADHGTKVALMEMHLKLHDQIQRICIESFWTTWSRSLDPASWSEGYEQFDQSQVLEHAVDLMGNNCAGVVRSQFRNQN